MLDDVIAITNRKLCQIPFREQIKRVCEIKPKAIILREKDISKKEYAKFAKEVYNITSQYKVQLIIHTHIDIARKLGIQTVHMSLQDLKSYRSLHDKKSYMSDNPGSHFNGYCDRDLSEYEEYHTDNKHNQADVRDSIKEDIYSYNINIGCSVHSVEEAIEAKRLGAAYITAGHIYATDCKKGLAPRGLGFLKDVCQSVSIPVYAIGGIGIDDGRRQEVKEYGAQGSCIMSAMMKL